MLLMILALDLVSKPYYDHIALFTLLSAGYQVLRGINIFLIININLTKWVS